DGLLHQMEGRPLGLILPRGTLASRLGSLSSRCRPYPGSTAKSIDAPFEERIHRSQVAVLSIGPPDSGGLSGIRIEFVHEFLNVPQGSRQLVDNRDRGALRSAGEGIQVDANHCFLHAYEGLRTVSVFHGDEYHICTEDSFTVREGASRIEAGAQGVGTKPEDALGPGARAQIDDFPDTVLCSLNH